MKKFLITLLCISLVHSAFAWGQKGHDVTAYIAECNLTPNAAARVDKILGGHSLVYYACWLDVASHTPEYDYTRTWHYLNIDEGKTLETMPKNANGDVLSAIELVVKALKSGELSPKKEDINLRMLIHLVGDIHCPMHTGRLSDLGGNKRPVLMFNHENDLHSVWDTAIPEATHRWSYTEWRQQLDRIGDEDIAMVQMGEPVDWLRETHEVCKDIYDYTPEGAKISYDYVAKATPIVEQQFLRGGYRLAGLLNEIYK